MSEIHLTPIFRMYKTGTLKSLQVYLAEKKENTGIRFNTDLPSVGRNLEAVVNLNGGKQPLHYHLISLPLYFAALINNIDIDTLTE